MRAEALTAVSPVPGVPKPDPVLVADGVNRHFGGLVAVDIDHLEVQRGTITGLIGPNGAGKTTLFNLLTGFDTPNGGSWSFLGRDLAGIAAHRVARLGMVRTFQLTKALVKLTVIDNMKLGATRQFGESALGALIPWKWQKQEKEIEARAESLLERFTLAHMRDDLAGTLSGGQRKLLELARALMVEPTLIMLDEPMAGVNPALTESLLVHIKALRDQGMSVVFIEHDMDVIMDISDWIVVMAGGKGIAEGRPARGVANPGVIDAYLGRRPGEAAAPVTGARAIDERQGEGRDNGI